MYSNQINSIEGVPDYKVNSFFEERNSYALLIPVLNENVRFTNQLNKIHESKIKVDIIIADGRSTDGSTEPNNLRNLGVNTLLTIESSGKLSAQLRMGIHFCLHRNYLGVITMDGNGKDEIDGISRIIKDLESGFDFIQGSRFLRAGDSINTPKLRFLAIKFLHAPITSFASGYKFTDSTNGFRGHSRRLLSDLRVSPLRDLFKTYELLAYLPIRAGQLNFKVKETPVKRTYSKKYGKQTKIIGVRSHAFLLMVLIKASFGLFNPKNFKKQI